MRGVYVIECKERGKARFASHGASAGLRAPPPQHDIGLAQVRRLPPLALGSISRIERAKGIDDFSRQRLARLDHFNITLAVPGLYDRDRFLVSVAELFEDHRTPIHVFPFVNRRAEARSGPILAPPPSFARLGRAGPPPSGVPQRCHLCQWREHRPRARAVEPHPSTSQIEPGDFDRHPARGSPRRSIRT